MGAEAAPNWEVLNGRLRSFNSSPEEQRQPSKVFLPESDTWSRVRGRGLCPTEDNIIKADNIRMREQREIEKAII